MFQTIHGHLLPSCNSFEGALKVWENAYTSKTFDGEWRGLRDRRDIGKTVWHQPGRPILFRFHSTDVVRWNTSEEVLVRTYDSASTPVFANRFLPPGVYAATKGGRMYVTDGTGYYSEATSAGVTVTKRDGKWAVDPATAASVTHRVLNRKKAAEIRQIVKPWTDWYQSMLRLGVNFALISQSVTFLEELRRHIHNRGIPESKYRLLAGMCPYDTAGDMDLIIRQAYALGGAVTIELAPPGSLPKKTVYDDLGAWLYV